ncbi:hypothetical protein FJW05_14645 [Mesorhizobium sp. B2-9-1]|uniref:hypothetical protein n=2 Tax=unclassified Mesorhizobium TaxID=325217 RepID=UPI001125EE7D|nr:hypothetical protein [Mesorhizobium sp. B1-1-5]TPI46729.1 hypothetical protein FJW05_14645 [Mesorhizobium sp. B2-9-1]TPO02321.1 hypothetical protein FJ980_18305 [Mesorhizobium sp. B1-1-5]
MVKSWNGRLSTPSIVGITPSLPTVGDVVQGQSMLAPTAGGLSFGAKFVAAQRTREGLKSYPGGI